MLSEAKHLMHPDKILRSAQDDRMVFGIDEAGRGPLAGPVVAACVHIPADKRGLSFWEGVTDSKKLTAKKREHLFDFIRENSVFGIAEASAREIDALNIHHATLLAMGRAFQFCHSDPRLERGEESRACGIRSFADAQDDKMVLIDGKFCPKLPCSAQAVVKGDSKHLEIAAASILAKVTRDRLMSALDEAFPAYGWAKNAGYGTARHMAAIQEFGITEHHRVSFAPCTMVKTG